ncbi:hypothetical protein ANN_13454 [Periplaneta americana]|uniref:Uncharacterized protein n=1 Tax=Periplaneta americana TaxID=6978 RepID=A0ABQ8TJW9_PERAM|nr:hypothetical protein ANN_13454 [Periplaneta americana]
MLDEGIDCYEDRSKSNALQNCEAMYEYHGMLINTIQYNSTSILPLSGLELILPAIHYDTDRLRPYMREVIPQIPRTDHSCLVNQVARPLIMSNASFLGLVKVSCNISALPPYQWQLDYFRGYQLELCDVVYAVGNFMVYGGCTVYFIFPERTLIFSSADWRNDTYRRPRLGDRANVQLCAAVSGRTWDPKNGLASMLTGYELHRACMELSQESHFQSSTSPINDSRTQECCLGRMGPFASGELRCVGTEYAPSHTRVPQVARIARPRNDYRKAIVALLSVLTCVCRHAEGGEVRADGSTVSSKKMNK